MEYIGLLGLFGLIGLIGLVDRVDPSSKGGAIRLMGLLGFIGLGGFWFSYLGKAKPPNFQDLVSAVLKKAAVPMRQADVFEEIGRIRPKIFAQIKETENVVPLGDGSKRWVWVEK